MLSDSKESGVREDDWWYFIRTPSTLGRIILFGESRGRGGSSFLGQYG